MESGQWDQFLLHLALYVRLSFSCQGLEIGKRVQKLGRHQWSNSHKNLSLLDFAHIQVTHCINHLCVFYLIHQSNIIHVNP